MSTISEFSVFTENSVFTNRWLILESGRYQYFGVLFMHTILAYTLYIMLSIATTIWVGRTLYKRGRIFILDSFNGNDELADSVNHLLIVGFYLLNVGFVCLFLKFGNAPKSVIETIEYISSKEGVVLLVLGGVHFFNIFNIAKMRKKALNARAMKENHVIATA